MFGDAIALTRLRPEHKFAALSMLQDYIDGGHGAYRFVYRYIQRDVDDFITTMAAKSRGEGLRPGQVPWSEYWLVENDAYFLGTSRIRHRLTPELRHHGGHIGFDVRPSERGKGYGTLLLRLTLEEAAELGLRQVLLTCDDDNLASSRVIEKNGGILEDQIISENTGALIRRYWITL